MYLKKVIIAIVEKSFWRKSKDKWKEKFHLHYINNRTVETMHYQVKTYQYLMKKYKHIIEKGVEPKEEAKRGNKIWICWLQGYENAPELVKACIHSVQINNPEKEIVILDDDIIENYIEIPDYIKNKRQNKIISLAHYSDYVRISILAKWGGIWLDSTVLCTSGNFIKEIANLPLVAYKQLDLIGKDNTAIVASNWFISAWSNQRILLLTQRLLSEYWRKENYLRDYFIFHIFFSIATRRYPEDWEKVPTYNNHSPHMLQFEFNEPFSKSRWDYLTYNSDLHKLNNHHIYDNNTNNFYKYVIETFQ